MSDFNRIRCLMRPDSARLSPTGVLAALAALCFLAPQIGAAQSSDAAPSDSVGHGVYLKYYCGLCHASQRAGTSGIFGPPHDGMKAIAAVRIKDENYRGEATTAAQYIRESILDPTVYVVPGFETSVHRMPAYTNLSAQEIEALVTFLLGESP